MKSISFDNPYWLFLAIPLLLALIIPVIISMNKDNRSRGFIASIIIHAVIIVSVTLAAAGLTYTSVMTRTKVYIVADVSYSMKDNFDEMDGYIKEIEDSMPQNSRLGIVCFGKDSVILTSSGTEVKSVSEAKVDDSGTDIAAALDYTSTLFSEGELKRIILITDGCDTNREGSVVSAVERLRAKEIKLDTVYVNSNLKDGDNEVQISDAEFTASTYIDHESALKVLVEANTDCDVILDLYRRAEDESEYVKLDTEVMKAEKGINILSFDLPTDAAGIYDYRAELKSAGDSSEHNNVFTFTQKVEGKRQILLITDNDMDFLAVNALYGEDADVDAYVRKRDIPYTVEQLSLYDEIILSNVDIRRINNINAFVDSVDTVVSRFGKSLITMGDLSMQNKDHEVFTKLEELLPVSYGNANKDEKLYTILLDVSRSMYDMSQLTIAKDAATKLISLLDDNDSVVYVPFAGKVLVEEGWKPMKLGDVVDFDSNTSGERITYRQWLYREIQNAEPYQGTLIGAALEQAYSNIKDLSFGESQVMIISDGVSYSHENEDAVALASELYVKHNITVSAISIISTDGRNMLPAIAAAGGGTHYSVERAEEISELVFATIADDLTESVIEKKTPVNIVSYRDKTLLGITELADIYGYINSKSKADATTVLTVDYQKNADTTVPVPLYAYRDHGNGRIATFTSSISGDWLDGWDNTTRSLFFGNVLVTNTPSERIDYPYDVRVNFASGESTVEIIPAYLTPRAKAMLKITSPDGTVTEQAMVFDRNRFYALCELGDIGKYGIEVTYSYGTHSFTSSTYYNVSYQNEYDEFYARDISAVYNFMRNIGKVYTDGGVDLEINKNEVATYEYSFRMPLLALAAALLVIEIFIRKTRWKDICNFFKKIKKGDKK